MALHKVKQKLNLKKIRASYLANMEQSLTDDGVVIFEPDKYNLDIDNEYLTLSADLTDIPSRELGKHLNAFTQQKMYMRTLVGRMECFVEEAKRKYLSVSAELYENINQKLSETAKERIINQDSRVKPYYEEYGDLKQRLNMLKLQVENIEDAIFLLSREVTRRGSDFSDENRSHNVGRI